MLKKLFLYLSIVFFVLLGFSVSGLGFDLAQAEEDDVSEEVNDLTDEIEKLEKKISELQNQGKTLANEIAYFDGQINLTQLRIQNAIAEIDKRNKLLADLVTDIGNLEERIDKLAASIDYQTNVLNERMRARYKSREASPLLVFFGSATFDSLVKKAEYLKILQEQDQKLLDEMKSTKDAFIMQKDLFEEKKQQTEELKAEVEAEKRNLEYYRTNLDSQRAEKENLLADTQNDEVKYQAELAKAKAQLDAIRSIVAGIDFKNGVEVEEGDIIAVMGNSGYPDCSTGAHLHLEVRKDGVPKDPEDYLEGKTLYVYDYDSGTKNIGDGDWEWPMSGPIVNQRFGKTPWSWRYPSGKHEGLDMEANDKFIYAPADGKMVKGSMGCYSSVIKYVAIDHGKDIVSYYLHIQ